MDTERSNICASFAADVEDGEVAVIVKLKELLAVDGTDAELTLDGRDERGALEEGTGQNFESPRELRLAAGKFVVEADDCNILLSGTLL